MSCLNKSKNICNHLPVLEFTTMCPPSPKRPRRTYDEQELDRLETVFAKNPYPDRDYRAMLAHQMKVSPKNIQIWFQNRRARERSLKRKAEGIVDNPIDRMRFQLLNLPPNSLKSKYSSNIQKCQNTPQCSTESETITHFPDSYENVEVNMTNSPIPSPSNYYHEIHKQNRFPLQTITTLQNVTASNSGKTTTTRKDDDCRIVVVDQQINLTSYNNLGNSYIPLPQQCSVSETSGDGPFSMSTSCYRLSLTSVSNLSDISNSSFSDLISVMENQDAKSELTSIHFSPSTDSVFDF